MIKTIKAVFITVFTLICLLSCGTSSKGEPEGTVNIKFSEYRQQIDGFGGSNAWTSLPRYPDTAEDLVKLLYSRTEGIGLTILRNRLPFRERLDADDNPGYNDGFVVRKSDDSYDYTTGADGTKTFNLNWNSWDIAGTKNLIAQIKALGNDGPEELIIMSTPWTPPNNRVTQWKEDVTGVSASLNGNIKWNMPDVWGRLKKDKFADYADLLGDYAANFEAKMGAPLAILSVQNEPNMKVDYESAYWSGTDLRDFLVMIEQRFPKKGIKLGEGGLTSRSLGIMIPEYENFNVNFNEMIKPTLESPAAQKILTHIALHQYNGGYDSSDKAGAKAFPEIIAAGKRFWQTEVSNLGSHVPYGNGIDNAIYYARMIHYDFTLTEINAFLFWWLWNNNNKTFTGALINVEDGENIITSKRLYAIGQFSRFIRPGWVRIESDTNPRAMVYSSAYRNPKTNEIAVVLVNDRSREYIISLDLTDAVFDQLAIWRTSEKENLKSIGKQSFSRSIANVSLPAKSIVTVYGRVKEL
jgi:O-glycosyl hydrolase